MQRVNLYTRGIRFKGPVLKVRYDGIKLFNALAPRRGYFTGVHFLQRDDSLQMDTVMPFDVQAMHPVTIYTGPQRRPCPTHFRLSRPPWPLHISHIVCTPLYHLTHGQISVPHVMPTHPPSSPTYITVPQGIVSQKSRPTFTRPILHCSVAHICSPSRPNDSLLGNCQDMPFIHSRPHFFKIDSKTIYTPST